MAGAVFGNQLGKGLEQYSSIIRPEVITTVKQSVTVIFSLPEPLQRIVITAYIKTVDYAFLLNVPSAGLSLIAGLFVRNWNLKEREEIGDKEMREKEGIVTEEERGAGTGEAA